MDVAASLLQTMTHTHRLKPDLHVYTSLAREEGRKGRAGGLTRLVEGMEGGRGEEGREEGVQADERLFAAALEGAARGGETVCVEGGGRKGGREGRKEG